MGWKQELKGQNEQNRDPVLLHSTPKCGQTFQKSVLFQNTFPYTVDLAPGQQH